MAQAQSKEQYVKAWTGHVKQLDSLRWPLANVHEGIHKLEMLQRELMFLINSAADEDFKGE